MGARADWGMIRNNILNPDMMGQISSNSALNTLRSATEPILQQFSEDLVAIRTKVTLILSSINEPEDSMFAEGHGPPTPAMKFIMDTWINYHITRNHLKDAIDIKRLVTDKAFGETDDMCQALVLWDCKMAMEMRSMLNTLLLQLHPPWTD
eukprot:TRINITY_DN28283_c0_g1_i1.p1 TRINITY_DN28283_c0_g1~~TRINITY_DN28283_c0_g1_i1.p1  ORF type:complete len:151 (-),score=53.71 TRINITY_DN28283_c0_g1_i1:222-674(-)